MSPLLRRLSGTRRRSRRDLERALEQAETDRDIARAQHDVVRRERAVMVAEVLEERDRARGGVAARAAERDAAHEALGKVGAAAGRPGAPTRWNIEDLVEWAVEAQSWRTRYTRMVQQSEAFEVQLIAVDEALAKVGAIPADDRCAAIASAISASPPTPAPTWRQRARAAVASIRTRASILAAFSEVAAQAEAEADEAGRQLLAAVDQRDTLSAELIAVDEALAELGASPADDRAEAIRAVPDGALSELLGTLDEWLAEEDISQQRRTALVQVVEWIASRRRAAWRAEHWDTHAPGHATPKPSTVQPRPCDLDGAPCTSPGGHDEPCRPIEGRDLGPLMTYGGSRLPYEPRRGH